MTKKLIALFIALVMLATTFTFLANADGANPFAIGVGDTPGGGNDFFASAQVIHSDFTVTGTLATDTEIDYYKLTVPIDGLVNFWLGNIPAGCDYDLMVFDEDEEVKWTSLSDNDYEEILGQEVSAGEIYYILVCAYSGYSTTQPYTLRAKVYPESYTYYTQRPTTIYVDTGYVPNPTNSIYPIGQMYNLYNTAGSSELTSKSWYWNLYKYGCVACSYSMILSNLNKKLDCSMTQNGFPDIINTVYGSNVSTISKYDSNGKANKINATPYSVMWSIANLPNIYYSAGSYYADTPYDMTLMDNNAAQRVSNLFNSTFTVYNSTVAYDESLGTNRDLTSDEKKDMIAYLLSQHPEGLCLYFNNDYMQWHMIVVTATTHQASLPTLEYIIHSQTTPINATVASQITSDCCASIDQQSLFYTEKSNYITDAMIGNYVTAVNSGNYNSIEDGNLFTVYDPVPGSYGFDVTTLDNCFTGVNNATWDDLKYIHVID